MPNNTDIRGHTFYNTRLVASEKDIVCKPNTPYLGSGGEHFQLLKNQLPPCIDCGFPANISEVWFSKREFYDGDNNNHNTGFGMDVMVRSGGSTLARRWGVVLGVTYSLGKPFFIVGFQFGRMKESSTVLIDRKEICISRSEYLDILLSADSYSQAVHVPYISSEQYYNTQVGTWVFKNEHKGESKKHLNYGLVIVSQNEMALVNNGVSARFFQTRYIDGSISKLNVTEFKQQKLAFNATRIFSFRRV